MTRRLGGYIRRCNNPGFRHTRKRFAGLSPQLANLYALKFGDTCLSNFNVFVPVFRGLFLTIDRFEVNLNGICCRIIGMRKLEGLLPEPGQANKVFRADLRRQDTDWTH